jgi:hypothetical protein
VAVAESQVLAIAPPCAGDGFGKKDIREVGLRRVDATRAALGRMDTKYSISLLTSSLTPITHHTPAAHCALFHSFKNGRLVLLGTFHPNIHPANNAYFYSNILAIDENI